MCYSHTVEELTVGFIAFAFGHQAVQFVNELGFHLKQTQMLLSFFPSHEEDFLGTWKHILFLQGKNPQ